MTHADSHPHRDDEERCKSPILRGACRAALLLIVERFMAPEQPEEQRRQGVELHRMAIEAAERGLRRERRGGSTARRGRRGESFRRPRSNVGGGRPMRLSRHGAPGCTMEGDPP